MTSVHPLLRNFLKFLFYCTLVCITLFLLFTLYRAPSVLHKQQSLKQVEYINSIHLDTATIEGTNIPPTPDETTNISTVEGVDSNHNYIRDDVELYIINKHKDNKPFRLAALQYAQSLQLEGMAVDNLTYQGVELAKDRAYSCIFDLLPWDNSLSRKENGDIRGKVQDEIQEGINSVQFNTALRKKAEIKFYEYLSSSFMGSIPERGDECPIKDSLK